MRSLLTRLTLGAAMVAGVPAAIPLAPVHANGAPTVLSGETPSAVVDGTATLVGRHDAKAVLNLNLGLKVHNSDLLDRLIAEENDPQNPRYGHFLTRADYLRQF